MTKSQIYLSIAALGVALYGIIAYQTNQACFEITKLGNPVLGEVLLDKCEGRTWALVNHEGTPSEIMGYATEEKEEKVKTLVWTRVHQGGGMLLLGEAKK